MKKIYTLSLLLTGVLSFGQVALPTYEPFNYTAGQNLQNQATWSILGTGTGDNILVSAASLTYPGLTSNGQKVSFSTGGIDDQKLISPQTTGTVYYSLLLNASSMAGVTDANGGYLAGFATNATTFGGSLWTKRIDDTSFNIGVEVRTANAANTTWAPLTYTTSQTYLIVVAYTFGAGANDDTAKLWINPTIGGPEPAATVTDIHTGADLTAINSFFLRQDSATETPALEIDELRIATNWTDATSTTVLDANKFNAISGLNIYPNPVSNGNLFITSDNGEAKTAEIYNVLGKVVLSTKASNKAINVSNLAKGVYIVKVTENGKISTRKLIIE